MQPESSDGLASVGTILPEEMAARISGGHFHFFYLLFSPPQLYRECPVAVKSGLELPT
jgi:hypothetical protein